MTADRPFIALGAPPRRQPRRAWRVRWTRDYWQVDPITGSPRWNHKWFLVEAAAMRLAERLASDATVEVDVFDLDHLGSVRVVDDSDCPF